MMKKKEFEYQKKLIELELVKSKEKHIMHMKELEYVRESDKIHHDRELERGRIKSAEIRKSMDRKQNIEWMKKNTN